MDFKRTNSARASARSRCPSLPPPSPCGKGSATPKTPRANMLPPSGATPQSARRRRSSSAALERSNSTSGRTFQRTNSTVGRQKGETIRQNNRVNVYVRVRAFADKEKSGEAAQLAVQMKDETVEVSVPQKGQFMFTFDGCFWSNNRDSPHHRHPASQDDVFEEVGRPLVENVLAGYNAAVMAYGQTGSGKTYTTYGPAGSLGTPEEGLVPRVCNMIFARAANSAQKGVHYTVRASMLEVYLDDVYDLLNHRKQLSVRNDFKNHTFAVVGAKNPTVTCYKDVLELLTKAEPLRTFAETKIHDHSSRAHTLFTLEVQTEFDDSDMKGRYARILMADLAGCERIRLAGTEEGVGFEEARNINLSLLALGSCIEAVASRKKKDHNNIPEFRNSTLTKLLKDFLGGNSVSIMMVTIAPSAKDANLSVQTLRFADRAKQITTHAKVNVIQEEEVEEGAIDYRRREEYAVKKEALYAEFQLEQTIEQLINRIVELEGKRNACTDADMIEHINVELSELEKALADAEYQLTCQRQILYGPILQLEDAVCELQTTIQKQRDDHEDELERIQTTHEKRLEELQSAHKTTLALHEASASEERNRQRQLVAAMKDEIEGLKALIAQLQNENAAWKKKYEDLVSSSSAREQELNDLVGALRTLVEDSNAAKQRIEEELSLQLSEEREAMREKTSKLSETEVTLTHTAAKLHETANTLRETDAALQETKNELRETQNALEEANHTNEDLSCRLREVELALDETRTRLDESELAREEVNATCEQTTASLEQTAARLFDAENRLQETNSLLKDNEAACEELNAKLTETEEVLEETSEKLCNAEANAAELACKLEEKEAMLEDLQARLSEREADLEESNGRVAESEANADELHARLVELEAAMEEAQTRISECDCAIEELDKKLAESEALRQEVAAAYEETQGRLAETERAREEMAARVIEIEAALEESETKVAELEGVIEDLDSKLGESDALREDIAAKLAETEALVEETAAQLTETEAAHEETAAKLAETEAVLEETTAKLAETEAAREETAAKLAETEAVLEETTARLNESEAVRDETAAQLAATESMLEEVANKLGDTEEELRDRSSKLVEAELSLEETSKRLGEEIQQLEMALDSYRGDLAMQSSFVDKVMEWQAVDVDTMLEGLSKVHHTGLSELSSEMVAYMARLQESLGMSEAEMEENMARFNLLRSVLCKIDQEVKVAVQDDAKPVVSARKSGLRNASTNLVA